LRQLDLHQLTGFASTGISQLDFAKPNTNFVFSGDVNNFRQQKMNNTFGLEGLSRVRGQEL
jgi:hypothetical protein